MKFDHRKLLSLQLSQLLIQSQEQKLSIAHSRLVRQLQLVSEL